MCIKVLNIITPGLGRGGITTSQIDIMRSMDKTDLQIDIAAVHIYDESIMKEFEDAGCKVICFPDRKKNTIKYVSSLSKCMKKGNYDIVHVHGSSAIMAIELMLAKHYGIGVRVAHSRNTRADNNIADRLMRPLFNHSYTHAFACGQDAGEWMFPNKEFTVIHNGKDLNKFSYDEKTRNEIREKFGLKDEVTIGFVGNLNTQKNIPFLIEIITQCSKMYNRWQFFIMGDGYQMDMLKHKVCENKLSSNVHLMGRISNVSEMLNAMDIMLLPSLYEGLPNVALEWQAEGLVCLISDKVTKECGTCDLVQFLPINSGTEIWVNKLCSIVSSGVIERRKENSELGCKCLREKGFDLEETTEFMKEFYLNRGNV